uniref:LysM domain-containing protein n=1 Tax=Populus trichocarpa TaxID=3694 RepID=A0A3N7EXH3_POPTR
MRMESNGGSHRLHHHINQKQNLKSNGKGKNRFTMPSPSSTTTATTMLSASTSSNSGVGFIEHPVSKLDTLAGVAIKYGVEVADIKKMNSLVTDLQMFALKSLQIPLPGRHQPSSFLSNGSDVPGQNSYERTPPRGLQSDLFDSFQSLKPKSSRFYRNGHSHHPEGGPYLKPSPASHPPLSLHRKTKSLANGFLDEKNGLVDKLYLDEVKEGESEKLVRRRQKSEADFTSIYTDLLIREESTGPAFSTITGKGLALRPKAGNRTTTDVDAGGLTSAQTGPGDLADGFLVVRKSSSATSLNDHDSISSSMWPTSKWNLKPDLQALSAAAITRPIFDGLPKPVTGRKNKTALD